MEPGRRPLVLFALSILALAAAIAWLAPASLLDSRIARATGGVVRLASAFGRLGQGTLTFVGDGPLRQQLEGRPGVSVTGYLPHDAVPLHLAAADVLCQPSLVEPFGQAALEALACGRSVVATRVGGPPEFVPPGAGVLVDPLDEPALAAALRAAAELAVPNPAARGAAELHDVRLQAARVEEILERAVRDRRA